MCHSVKAAINCLSLGSPAEGSVTPGALNNPSNITDMNSAFSSPGRPLNPCDQGAFWKSLQRTICPSRQMANVYAMLSTPPLCRWEFLPV